MSKKIKIGLILLISSIFLVTINGFLQISYTLYEPKNITTGDITGWSASTGHLSSGETRSAYIGTDGVPSIYFPNPFPVSIRAYIVLKNYSSSSVFHVFLTNMLMGKNYTMMQMVSGSGSSMISGRNWETFVGAIGSVYMIQFVNNGPDSIEFACKIEVTMDGGFKFIFDMIIPMIVFGLILASIILVLWERKVQKN